MTSIKPPTSPSTAPIEPSSSLPGTDSTRPSEAPEAGAEVHAAGASSPTDPIAALAADVEAGRIGMNEAVEQLLERTVSQLGSRLSSEERAGLSAMLREALEADPALTSLR